MSESEKQAELEARLEEDIRNGGAFTDLRDKPGAVPYVTNLAGMTNQERARRYLLDRGLGYRINEQLLDAVVGYGIECADAELERRRAAESERDDALGRVHQARAQRDEAMENAKVLARWCFEQAAANRGQEARIAKLEAFKRAVLEERHELR